MELTSPSWIKRAEWFPVVISMTLRFIECTKWKRLAMTHSMQWLIHAFSDTLEKQNAGKTQEISCFVFCFPLNSTNLLSPPVSTGLTFEASWQTKSLWAYSWKSPSNPEQSNLILVCAMFTLSVNNSGHPLPLIDFPSLTGGYSKGREARLGCGRGMGCLSVS